MSGAPTRRVLIVVENLPVPFDRRVWSEATELARAGYAVSVICPTGKGFDAPYEEIEGVRAVECAPAARSRRGPRSPGA